MLVRLAFVCAAILSSLLATNAAAAPKFAIPPTPLEAKPGDLHAFYGEVKAVNRGARTITLGMPMRFTFKVSGETQITVRGGGAVAFDGINPGAGVQIEARREASGWSALKIKLQPGATFPEELSVKTVQGKTITGPDAAEFVAYEPPSQLINRNINFGQRSGSFILSVRPDGTVANVRPAKSLGVKELDERSIARLRKVKFRPNSVTEARVPVSFSSFRRY